MKSKRNMVGNLAWNNKKTQGMGRHKSDGGKKENSRIKQQELNLRNKLNDNVAILH